MSGNPSLKIELGGNAAPLVQEMGKGEKAQEKLTEAVTGGASAAKQASDETIKKMNFQHRAATRLVRKHEDLEETYKRELRTLIKARKDGAVSNEEYRKTVDRIKTSLREQGKTQDEAVGDSAVGKVTNYATKFATIAGSVAVVTKALQFFNEEREKATGQTDSLADVRRSLRSLPDDFGQLEREADEIAGLIGDRVEARRIRFDAASQGVDQKGVKLVAALDSVIKATSGIEFAGGFRRAFEGDKLSVEQALNTALVASATSQLNPEQILPQLLKAGVGGSVLGATSSDVSAIVSVLATNFREGTGNRVSALASQFATDKEKRFQGLDLIESIEKLQTFTDEQRGEFLGGNKEILGTLTIANQKLDEIKNVDRKIEEQQRAAGTKNSVARREIAQAFDVSTREGRLELARVRRNQAAVELDIKREQQLSETGLVGEARADQARTRLGFKRPNWFAFNDPGFLTNAGAHWGVSLAEASGHLDEQVKETRSTNQLLGEMLGEIRQQGDELRNMNQQNQGRPQSLPGEDR